MPKFLLKSKRGLKTPFEITVDSKSISFDRFSIALSDVLFGEGKGMVRGPSQSIPFYALKRKKEIEIWMNGKIHRFEIMDSSQRSQGDHAPGAAKDITAPMPGKILKIMVKTGDAVDAGEALLVMESMKMEITLTSGASGKIAQINCKPGDMTDIGKQLVILEEPGGSSSR